MPGSDLSEVLMSISVFKVPGTVRKPPESPQLDESFQSDDPQPFVKLSTFKEISCPKSGFCTLKGDDCP